MRSKNNDSTKDDLDVICWSGWNSHRVEFQEVAIAENLILMTRKACLINRDVDKWGYITLSNVVKAV